MTVRGFTPAEHTAAMLQEAAQRGTPMMIPGAFEPRLVHPVRLANVTAASLTSDVPNAVMNDRQRFEYEREGGGAARQRKPPGRRQTTALARLWHWAAHLAADPVADSPV